MKKINFNLRIKVEFFLFLFYFLFQRPKTSSALFFSYNTQLGPPYHVLVDTNFINFSIKNKLDVIQSMMDCMYAKCIPYITDCVMAELEKLGRPDIMIVVGGVIPPSDVQTLIDMGAAAVYPPGSVVAETAIDLIDKLNQRLGYAQKP